MKKEKRDNEIRVLDKGKDVDGKITQISVCCAGMLIPLIW